MCNMSKRWVMDGVGDTVMTIRAPAVLIMVTPAHLKSMHALSSCQSSYINATTRDRDHRSSDPHIDHVIHRNYNNKRPQIIWNNHMLGDLVFTETYSRARQQNNNRLVRELLVQMWSGSHRCLTKKERHKQPNQQTNKNRKSRMRSRGRWHLRRFAAT